MVIEYSLLKVLHLGALIFWLGPALGAWLVLKMVEGGHQNFHNETAARVSRAFYLMITLEHLAFIALLASGATLAYRYNLWASPWLEQKLFIVGLIVIPLEIIDVILGNWLCARAERRLYQGREVLPRQRAWLKVYHGVFTRAAIVIIPTSVLAIMWLAVSKSPW